MINFREKLRGRSDNMQHKKDRSAKNRSTWDETQTPAAHLQLWQQKAAQAQWAVVVCSKFVNKKVRIFVITKLMYANKNVYRIRSIDIYVKDRITVFVLVFQL